MGILIRSVVSGFGFNLGAALFKKLSKRIGLDEPDKNMKPDPDVADDGEIEDADEPTTH